MSTKLLALLAAMALLIAACGGSPGGNDGSGGAGDHTGHSGGAAHEAGSSQGTVPGSVADASEADTEILVTASDELEFDPDSVDVRAGDVVTFVIRNKGNSDHEFVLGDEAYQEMHEKDMAEGHEMSDMQNAVTVGAGETKELTWEFTDSGAVLFGCHEPGHYDAGMVGTIEVG